MYNVCRKVTSPLTTYKTPTTLPDQKLSKLESRIHKEFHCLFEKTKSNKKTYHKLMLRYHPDKCSDVDAKEISQILNDKYAPKSKIF